MTNLVTKLEDVKGWETLSGDAYQRSQLRWKTFVSRELVGSGNMSFGLAVLDPGRVHGVHHHPHANEFYYVLVGLAKVTLGDKNFVAGPGTTIYIPKGTKHGVVNESEKPFSFIWVIEGKVPIEDY